MRHSTSYGMAARTRSPRSLAVTISAVLSPARLNAFVAAVTAMPCSRAASDTVRNGVYGVAGLRERPVHLVGDDRRVVAGGDLGEGGERRGIRHRAGGVVRIAEQHRAGARVERRIDPLEVERPALVDAAEERHLDDGAPGLGEQVEERVVDRRRDDHAVAGSVTRRSTSTLPRLTSAVQVTRAGSTSQPSRSAAKPWNASATGRLPDE